MLKFFLKLLAFFLCWWRSWKYYDSNLRECYSLTAMGSKTAYANNGLVAFRERSEFPGRLVHANVLFQHGTRSPKNKRLAMMEKFAETLKPRKELSDFNFTFNCRGSGPMELLPAGVQELEKLGLRWRRRLSREFSQPLNAKVYVSPTNRTKDSAKAFVSKFFDSPGSVSYEEDSYHLRFYDGCDRYAKTIRKNITLLTEWLAFKEGPEMKKVLAEIVADNSLHDLNSTLDDIEELYTMATHEASLMQADDEVSGWLKLFRPEHLYVLEYLHDLKHYWAKANPFPVSYEQACPLWGTIMDQMWRSAQCDMHPLDIKVCAEAKLSVFWFGHAETLIPLVVKLGLFNESVQTPLGGGDHLRASNFQSRLDRLASRPPVFNLFRTAHITPFAGNIAFLLFHHPRSQQGSSLDDYVVEVLLNEKTVDILPHVPRKDLTLARLLDHFSSCSLQAHNQKKLCALPDN